MKNLLFFLFLTLNVFGQVLTTNQHNSSSNYDWKPYLKIVLETNIDVSNDISPKSNFAELNSIHPYIKNNRSLLNKSYLSRNLGSSWEKMNGPYGGSVRQFYEYDDKLYAITDREVFCYQTNGWNPLNFGNFNNRDIYFLHKANNNRLMVGCDSGLWFTDNEGERWEKIILNGSISAYDMYKLKNGDLLLSTSDGIYISDKDSTIFTSFTLKGKKVYTINIDNLENIWAGTSSGILKANLADLIWVNIGLEGSYAKIIFDSNNTVYTTSNDKVFMSEDQGMSWSEISSLDDLYVTDIILDPEENLIVTTFYKIIRFDKDGFLSESSKFYYSLLTTFFFENEVYLGTLGSGAKKYDLTDNVSYDFSEGMNTATIREIISMANGDILSCTDADTFYISKDNGFTWESTYNYWSMFFETSNDGSVYALANCKIIKSEDFGKTWKNLDIGYSTQCIKTLDISEDSKTICVGTSNGEIFVSNSSGESFIKVQEANDISVDIIKVIDNETFLIKNGGLYYTKDGGETLNEVEDTLVNKSTPTGIVVDDFGYIYLSSYRGIFRSLDGLNWLPLMLDELKIKFLEIDQVGNLYAATSFGSVYLSNDHGNNWEAITEGIPSTAFWSFTISSDGYIFYGSQNRGLFRTKPEIKTKEFKQVSISSNFPNPFNASTRIEYVLPKDSFVELEVYDLLGRKIEILISEYKSIGEHYINWNPKNQSSGVYFYKLQIGSEIQVNKMIYLK